MFMNVSEAHSSLSNASAAEIFPTNDSQLEPLPTKRSLETLNGNISSVLTAAISTATSSGIVLVGAAAKGTTAASESGWGITGVEYDIDLDEWDRALIIGAVAVFLLVVLMVLVCSLGPDCPLHAFCPIDYGDGCRKVKSSGFPVYGSMDDPVFDKGVANGKRHGKVQSHNGQPQRPIPKARLHSLSKSPFYTSKTARDCSEPSDWSDVSLPEMIELKHESHGKSRKTHPTSDYSSSTSSITSPLQPDSRLAYGLTFDRAHSRLYIRVIQLGNFRVTDPDGALSPYVKVRVYRTPRHFFTFKLKAVRELPLNQLEAEMQTRIQRRTDNPVFNEFFELIVEDPDVTAYTVKFLVCDYDKYSRHVVVGEVTVELSKVDLSSAEEILFNDLIDNHHEDNLGELHVALMYLPTAEKLSVSILNAKGLCAVEAPKKHSDAAVKLVLMYDGRPLRKTKTTARTNDSCPVFNETFVFDVPAYQLDKIYFHLAVIGIEKDREDGRHLLGRVYIGVNFDPDAKAQWLEMVHNARKQVACWHRLQS